MQFRNYYRKIDAGKMNRATCIHMHALFLRSVTRSRLGDLPKSGIRTSIMSPTRRPHYRKTRSSLRPHDRAMTSGSTKEATAWLEPGIAL
jgi:hypothetical protein